ncbi:MAG: cob(I)yrinic acid a,c-diamide adenosyltransferase [Bacteroidia bacterium]|nr:cob(I)yrinic acid a,c-diamide adenosyltransferase [Bacteroidia bacterium]NNJ56198.1 cob(I)yrinic acid a,c-diamide adenosyltransferase [Bacteroidia bacterium]
MKIYTKTGDKGETSLLGGTRVSKANQKLEAYGTVDELNSHVGMVASLNDNHKTFLQNIQHRLFNIGSLLATEKEVSFELPSIKIEDIEVLEQEIDKLNENLPTLKNFILPGGSSSSAQAHIARCVCRRAERRVVALQNENYTILVQYLNRLSDYLFVLSRDLLRIEEKEEVIWEKD